MPALGLLFSAARIHAHRRLGDGRLARRAVGMEMLMRWCMAMEGWRLPDCLTARTDPAQSRRRGLTD